jgi:phage terminase large subunit GpA-like protein
MDAMCDPLVDEVVIMSSAQIGKTQMINNVIGYHIDVDPCPILSVQPTEEFAKNWSKERLAPMLRDTPCLQGKVRDSRTRDSDNTVLKKGFPGGFLAVVGANSPVGLSGRPARIVLADEIDRFPASAGAEGDPLNLAFKRATTFWNRKRVVVSTPTVKGFSRIEREYEKSDQRQYFVPCPHCGEMQTLKFPQVKWDKTEDGTHLPETARYECEFCQNIMTDKDKPRLLQWGKWIPGKESKGIAGFHINELYSPWVPLAQTVNDFLLARNDPQTLKTWVNTALGETWEEKSEKVDGDSLMNRREGYTETPQEAGCLTCAVDVQKDRLELEVVAWGKGKETWGVEYKILPGDPLRPEVWAELDEYLKTPHLHTSGISLPILVTCIDTGYLLDQVATFVRGKEHRHIVAVKGQQRVGYNRIISERPSKRTHKKRKYTLYNVGTFAAKEAIYDRLRLEMQGPGYMHFPLSYPKGYFDQLTAEKQVTTYERGFPKKVWVKKLGVRNEALDIRVYNLAAYAYLEQFTAFSIDKRVDELKAQAEARKAEQPTPVEEPKPAARPFVQRRKNWVTGWKR